MPVWPLTLPQAPLRNGFTDTVPNELLRSDMETGPAKVRRRGGSKPHVVQASYALYDEEADLLEAFVRDTLAGGAIAFDWPHPLLKRYVRARLAPSDNGLLERSYFADSLCWQYTLNIEYWPDVPVAGV